MAELPGPGSGTSGAASKISCALQAGDLQEVGGGTSVGWGPDLQDKIQDAEKPEAGRYSCWEHQGGCLTALPDEDGALSFRAVPPLDKEPAQRYFSTTGRVQGPGLLRRRA